MASLIVELDVWRRRLPRRCHGLKRPVDQGLVAEDSLGVLHNLIFDILKTNVYRDVDVGRGTGHSSDFFENDMGVGGK